MQHKTTLKSVRIIVTSDEAHEISHYVSLSQPMLDLLSHDIKALVEKYKSITYIK